MHIQQIEIDNFKSFSGKTTIPFLEGFTTVSGPNGSGKSNIIDSVLFCLGLSSSRTMRAEKLTDLINHHSRRRDALVSITFNKNSTGFPSLSLIPKELLTTDDPETVSPSTGETTELPPPAEAACEEAAPPNGPVDEGLLTISRRIKEGKNGYTSTYYMDGHVKTLTEIHEYLAQFHISPGCYNVMMQGDVASIVNISANERRKIIDEIAGVAEFDRKIEQAQKEIEATNQNIDRNRILLDEINARLEQLKEERETALKYQKLKEDRQNHEAKLLAARLKDLEKALELTQANLIQARQKKKDCEKELKALEAGLDKTRGDLLDISQEVKRKGEDQQIAIKKQIESLKGHVARKEDACKFNNEKKQENLSGVEKMQADITRLQENMEAIDSDIEGLKHQEKELEALFNKEAKAYEKLNSKFDALTNVGGEWANQRTEVRTRLEATSDEIAQLIRDKMELEAETTRLAYEMEHRQRESASVSEKEKALSEQKKNLEKEQAALEAEKAKLETALQKQQLDYSQMRVAVNTAVEKANIAARTYAQLEARKRAYEEVNLGMAVETILRSDLTGVHGTLGQLLQVDEQYALALEIAIGGRISQIVVDSDRIAQQGIQLLQKNRAGRATFLPLNKMRKGKGLPRLPSGSGVIDFAVNLIRFEAKYQEIFDYALGETLVVEDISSARELLQAYRMVTLDGSLLERSGAMSGGSQGKTKGGRLFNAGKVEEELAKLQNELDSAEAEKRRLENHLTQMEAEMDQKKAEYGRCMHGYTRVQAELEAIEKQFQAIASSSMRGEGGPSKTKPQGDDLETLKTRLKDLALQKGRLEKQITQKEKDLEGLRGELEGVEAKLPSAQMDTLRQELSEVKFQMDYYDSQLRNVQTDLKSKAMERHYQEVGAQEFKERIEQALAQNKALDKETIEHREEIQLTQKQIQDLDAQTSVLDEELKRLQDQRDEIQAKLLEQEKAKDRLERETAQLEEQATSFQARARELEPQIQALKEEIEATGQSLAELRAQETGTEEELLQAIQRLTKRMEAMEPVNMLAIQEYDQIQERNQELSDKVETLANEAQTLQFKIMGYEEMKKFHFMQAFENVDQQFKTIFAELSDGVGRLILTNPDDPLNGGLTLEAQPRGKKMLRLEAMSGGEKSLTSLAFVFSLQRYMPAPFYALDEVDMNLDGINVEKLARMIQRESKNAQFVVVSLRKPMLEHSDQTIGVTQRQNGITKVTGIKIRHAEPPPPIPHPTLTQSQHPSKHKAQARKPKEAPGGKHAVSA